MGTFTAYQDIVDVLFLYRYFKTKVLLGKYYRQLCHEVFKDLLLVNVDVSSKPEALPLLVVSCYDVERSHNLKAFELGLLQRVGKHLSRFNLLPGFDLIRDCTALRSLREVATALVSLGRMVDKILVQNRLVI